MKKAHHHQQEACCTCATLLSKTMGVNAISLTSEKPLSDHQDLNRRLDCCSRTICADCILKNPRFLTYCPYCQTSGRAFSSTSPSTSRRIHMDITLNLEPPPYSPCPPPDPGLPPPAYSHSPSLPREKEKEVPPQEDTLHFLSPNDTIPSLSLTYNVPPHVLRAHNNLPSDQLLPARRTVLIPASFHKSGISHSPRPVEGEEEELRKSKIRRWMVACKEHNYDVAVLYLQQAGYDLDEAVARYTDDERWERENPLQAGGKITKNMNKNKIKTRKGFLFG